MAVIVFPSENNVGTLLGYPARVPGEQSWSLLNRVLSQASTSFVFSGFDLVSTGSNGVKLTYGSGGHYALINGLVISFDADITLTGLSNATHYIYAQLTKVSSLVTTWGLVSNTTGTWPTDSLLLGRVVVSGGVAGTPTNVPKNPGVVSGSYAGNGSGSQTIFVGVNARLGLLYGNGDFAFIVPSGQMGVHDSSTANWVRGTAGATYFPVFTSNGFIVYSHNTSGQTYYYWLFC